MRSNVCTLRLTCLVPHCRPGNNRQVHAMSLDRLRVRDEEVRPSAEHIAQNNRHDFRRRCPRLPHLCRSNRSDCAPSCPGPILSPRSRSRAVGVPLFGPGSVGLVNLDVDSPHPNRPPFPSQPRRSSPVRLLTRVRLLLGQVDFVTPSCLLPSGEWTYGLMPSQRTHPFKHLVSDAADSQLVRAGIRSRLA